MSSPFQGFIPLETLNRGAGLPGDEDITEGSREQAHIGIEIAIGIEIVIGSIFSLDSDPDFDLDLEYLDGMCHLFIRNGLG